MHRYNFEIDKEKLNGFLHDSNMEIQNKFDSPRYRQGLNMILCHTQNGDRLSFIPSGRPDSLGSEYVLGINTSNVKSVDELIERIRGDIPIEFPNQLNSEKPIIMGQVVFEIK